MGRSSYADWRRVVRALGLRPILSPAECIMSAVRGHTAVFWIRRRGPLVWVSAPFASSDHEAADRAARALDVKVSHYSVPPVHPEAA